jgi:hypothetical protein
VLAVRACLAELAGVPPEALRTSDRIFVELRHLPFYDSLDLWEFVLLLQEQMGVHVPEDRIFALFAQKDTHRVAIRDLIQVGIDQSTQAAPSET